MNDLSLRETLCDVGARLWQRGLVSGNEGNLSARTGRGTFLATPSGVSKGHLEPGDLVEIDETGAALGAGQPSSEIRIHLAAYAARPDCHAVVHAHPPTGIAMTVAGVEVPDGVLPEAAYVLGRVPTVPFGMPGTSDLSDRLAPFLADHKTFLLTHHGALALGRDVLDACYRMECLESVCKVVAQARALGAVTPMPSEAWETFRPMAEDGAFR